MLITRKLFSPEETGGSEPAEPQQPASGTQQEPADTSDDLLDATLDDERDPDNIEKNGGKQPAKQPAGEGEEDDPAKMPPVEGEGDEPPAGEGEEDYKTKYSDLEARYQQLEEKWGLALPLLKELHEKGRQQPAQQQPAEPKLDEILSSEFDQVGAGKMKKVLSAFAREMGIDPAKLKRVMSDVDFLGQAVQGREVQFERQEAVKRFESEGRSPVEIKKALDFATQEYKKFQSGESKVWPGDYQAVMERGLYRASVEAAAAKKKQDEQRAKGKLAGQKRSDVNAGSRSSIKTGRRDLAGIKSQQELLDAVLADDE